MARQITRRQAIQALGMLGAAALGPAPRAVAAKSKTQRPNILFIMADDHDADAMSCYGSRINKTPNIDRIANDGIRFDNCFCTNAICGPSRATILTGKYSHINGFIDNSSRFDGSQQTFPKLLQKAGYQTGIVGKWHLMSEPTGFDYWNVLPGQGVYHDPQMIEMGQKTKHTGYVTDLIADFSIDFLKNRDAEKPFCLMCHHKAPHRSWNPDAKHAAMYEDVDIPEPPTFNDDYATRGTAAHTAEMRIDRDLNKDDLKVDPPEGLTPEQLKHWKYERYIKDYLRVIASVDDNVGRLLDYLDQSGLAENTLVIYTSDQGFFLGDHGWFDKRFMYEDSLRMPFIARFPGLTQPGSVADAMSLNVDFAPTFLDLAGAAIPDDIQGRSLQPILKGQPPKNWRNSMYYHYYEYPAVHSVRRHYGIRTLEHKLIHYYYGMDEWELFDLKKDPDELRNLYDDPAYAKVCENLKGELARLRKELKVPPDEQPEQKS